MTLTFCLQRTGLASRSRQPLRHNMLIRFAVIIKAMLENGQQKLHF